MRPKSVNERKIEAVSNKTIISVKDTKITILAHN